MQKDDIKAFLELPLFELVSLANETRKKFLKPEIELCNIMNAKSGFCAEDCKFCAQSSYHHTRASKYTLKTKEEMIEAARRAKEIGAERFDIVTSGDNLSKDELNIICDAVCEITGKLGIKMCASLGTLKEDDFRMLKQSGLSRYHHNIETSERYFSKIVNISDLDICLGIFLINNVFKFGSCPK